MTAPEAHLTVVVIGGDEETAAVLRTMGLVPMSTAATGAVWWASNLSPIGEAQKVEDEARLQMWRTDEQ